MAARIIFLSSYSPAARSFTQAHRQKNSAHTGQTSRFVSFVSLFLITHHFDELINVLDWLQFSWEVVQLVAGFWPERDRQKKRKKKHFINPRQRKESRDDLNWSIFYFMFSLSLRGKSLTSVVFYLITLVSLPSACCIRTKLARLNYLSGGLKHLTC